MNHATRITVATLGVIWGISGMSHGFFETLQGNAPTDGMFISAIGEAHRMWVHGNEYAFTLVPNFFITGILAMMVGLAIITWSVGFVHKKHGPLVFLLLFILLFLVGGGVAQIVFFTLTWAVATRINRPLAWWRKVLPADVRRVLAWLWPWSLIAGSLLMLSTLAIATFGFAPGVNDPDQVLTVMLSSLGAGFSMILLTFVAGFAHDIERRADKEGRGGGRNGATASHPKGEQVTGTIARRLFQLGGASRRSEKELLGTAGRNTRNPAHSYAPMSGLPSRGVPSMSASGASAAMPASTHGETTCRR